MKLLIICILMSMALPGCQGLRDTANATVVDSIIVTGEAAKTISTVKLNDFEALMVRNSENEYVAIRNKWKHKVATIDVSGSEFIELIADYNLLKNRYFAIDKIVTEHWEEYSDDQRYILVYYQAKALQLDDSVERMISAGKRREVLMETLALVGVAVRVAAEFH